MLVSVIAIIYYAILLQEFLHYDSFLDDPFFFLSHYVEFDLLWLFEAWKFGVLHAYSDVYEFVYRLEFPEAEKAAILFEVSLYGSLNHLV